MARIVCSYCDGTGRVKGDFELECSYCMGRGHLRSEFINFCICCEVGPLFVLREHPNSLVFKCRNCNAEFTLLLIKSASNKGGIKNEV